MRSPSSHRKRSRPGPRAKVGTLKIATFNINNVRKRLPNLLDWLASAKPDVVSLQELKTAHAQFPLGPIQEAGYHAVWKGEKTWKAGHVVQARSQSRSETHPGRTDPILDALKRMTAARPCNLLLYGIR